MTQSKMREKSREGKMPVYSRYDSDIKKGNKKNGGRGVGKEIRITFQGLSGNTNQYNDLDCNHVQVVLKTVCE